MDRHLEWVEDCLRWMDVQLRMTLRYLRLDGRQLIGLGVAAFLLLATYAYYRRATSWRVVPSGIPWYFSEPNSKGKTPAWSAQVGAHLKDFNTGIDSVQTGYREVREFLVIRQTSNLLT